MKIAISGISGFVGSELKVFFEGYSYEVIGLKVREGVSSEEIANTIDGCDVIINMAGVSIFGRWSESYKQELYNSRIKTTQKIVEGISICTNRPKHLISTSAIGIYQDEVMSDEESEYGESFLSSICQDWEKEALKADIKTTICRFGVVLGENGGMIKKMWVPFSLGLGGVVGSGRQSLSWIHIEDLCEAYKFIIEKELDGVYNLTAPNPTTNAELTKELAWNMNRPAIFPIPAFVIKLLFSEGSDMMLHGQKVLPKRLLEAGFTFRFDAIQKAIKSFFTKDLS